MFISFVLIQVKRTKEKIKASTKFAKILRKNVKNDRLASLRQYHFLNTFSSNFLTQIS
ncbi:MAG: hypothetical protein J7K51_04760 [Thermotogae bacterium]|nr:hypothetical protein [Thermotogota bacterium]